MACHPDRARASYRPLFVIVVRFCLAEAHLLAPLQLRVFEQALEAPPPDDSEQLTLLVAALRFLDLLLVLQLEDFQMSVAFPPLFSSRARGRRPCYVTDSRTTPFNSHQWMFVHDSAPGPSSSSSLDSDSGRPTALLDRLAQTLGGDNMERSSIPPFANGVTSATDSDSTLDPGRRPKHKRRPLLLSLPIANSASQLIPFLAAVSERTFERAYCAPEGEGDVDWAAVEAGFRAEVFERR